MISESWALLRMNPLCQNHYLEFMDDHRPGIEFYFPKYNRIRRPANHRRPVVEQLPVYPGYVFVRFGFDKDEFRFLIGAPIRAYFVMFGRKRRTRRIGLVTQEVINELRLKEQRGELIKEEKKEDPYYPGRVVRVVTPVTSILGVLVMCTHLKARAVVDTGFGSWDVPIQQVELM
jgi:transcription antitermination factor NusG